MRKDRGHVESAGDDGRATLISASQSRTRRWAETMRSAADPARLQRREMAWAEFPRSADGQERRLMWWPGRWRGCRHHREERAVRRIVMSCRAHRGFSASASAARFESSRFARRRRRIRVQPNRLPSAPPDRVGVITSRRGEQEAVVARATAAGEVAVASTLTASKALSE